MRIPVTLVTGFLGSGKTTLVNKLLKLDAMPEAIIIVNEFGEISIDSDLMVESSDNIVQLSNGCLCCSVKGELIDTFRDLTIKRLGHIIPKFNRVLIETTGVADPRPVLDLILSNPMIRDRYVLDGVIATFDAINGPDALMNFPESVHQIASADCVVITKSDLLGSPSEGIATLENEIRAFNPSAKIILGNVATSEPDQLFGLGLLNVKQEVDRNDSQWIIPEQYDLTKSRASQKSIGTRKSFGEVSKIYQMQSHAGGDTHAHHHGDIQSVCFVREKPIPQILLEHFLEGLSRAFSDNLLRVKGFVCTLEHPETPAVIQGAQKLVHALEWLPSWPTTDRRTRIVFIGRGIQLDEIEESFSLIERVVSRTRSVQLGNGSQQLGADNV